MSNGGAPDCWEQEADGASDAAESKAIATKFSTLNVNAAEFIPSFSYSVPSSQESAEEPDKAESPVTNGGVTGEGETAEVVSEEKAVSGGGSVVSGGDADSWEAAAEDSDAAVPLTPEEDDEEEEEGEEVQIKPKKKPVRGPEETKSKKEHINVVIIGHVDAGKSTIGGQIMALTGMVDKRTLEKYEREAKEKSRESWYLSWALDTNQEEREKGKTVEVGRAYFETDKKHFTILDAPGHKSFVPNMIGGTAQADLAVLVISARKGEFETGFDRGGQTREHAMLAKTAGVKHMVVLINKMDDPTVEWAESRYNECKDKIMPYLKKLGFNPQKDLTFMPVSGLTGLGLKEAIDAKICPWYRGEPFITFIDSLPSVNRKMDGPFLMPVVEKYKDMGTVVMGKVESGAMKKGQSLILMPNRTPVIVDQVWSDEEEVTSVGAGENIKVKLKGIEEEDVSPGFVLCDPSAPVRTGKVFDAQVVILEHKSIICAGYSAVMHINCVAEEVTVKTLLCLIDKKTCEKSQQRPRFVKQDQVAIMRIECAGVICLEPFKLFPQMGRFTLRDEDGVGKEVVSMRGDTEADRRDDRASASSPEPEALTKQQNGPLATNTNHLSTDELISSNSGGVSFDSLDRGLSIEHGLETLYIEQRNGTFKPTSTSDFVMNTIRQQYYNNNKRNRCCIRSALDMAILVQKTWYCLSNFCFGILAGVAALHLIIMFSTLPISARDPDSNLRTVEIYSNTAFILPIIFYVCLTICLISLIDRFDTSQLENDDLKDTFSYKFLWAVIILYLVIFLLHSLSSKYDDLFVLYPYDKSFTRPHQNLLAHLDIWRWLDGSKCVLCVVGWMLVSLVPSKDFLLHHLDYLKTYDIDSPMSPLPPQP